MKVIWDAGICRGCRTCELACSFHHARVFSPQLSSVRVTRNNRSGTIAWSIDSTCDFCKGESSLLCLEYCPYGALGEMK